jgi:hypothetical protein
MNTKNKEQNSVGSEALGSIIFTIIVVLLMWGASKWFL